MIHAFDYFREMTFAGVALRLLLAMICGGAIGVNRAQKHRLDIGVDADVGPSARDHKPAGIPARLEVLHVGGRDGLDALV